MASKDAGLLGQQRCGPGQQRWTWPAKVDLASREGESVKVLIGQLPDCSGWCWKGTWWTLCVLTVVRKSVIETSLIGPWSSTFCINWNLTYDSSFFPSFFILITVALVILKLVLNSASNLSAISLSLLDSRIALSHLMFPCTSCCLPLTMPVLNESEGKECSLLSNSNHGYYQNGVEQ